MTGAELSDLKAALDMYTSQYGATDKLWTYFSSVTLAVLGFTIASDKVSKSFVEAFIVAIGYLVFCFGNFTALHLSQKQLIEFAAIARPVAAKYNVTLDTLQPLPAASIAVFYWAVVTAVCIGILVITWRRHAKPTVL